MGKIKQNFKEWLSYVRFVLFDCDNVEDKTTIENQIKTINSCGQQLAEGDKRILEDSLKDIEMVENEFTVRFSPTLSKFQVQKIAPNESKAIEATKKIEETNIENERN